MDNYLVISDLQGKTTLSKEAAINELIESGYNRDGKGELIPRKKLNEMSIKDIHGMLDVFYNPQNYNI